jgi:hypothetical protein
LPSLGYYRDDSLGSHVTLLFYLNISKRASSNTTKTFLKLADANTSPYSFAVFDTTIFTTDDSSVTPGVTRFDFDASTSTWKESYTLSSFSTATRGLTAYVDPENPSQYLIFATTTSNQLVVLTEPVVATAGAATFKVLATAAANTAFRGVAAVPAGVPSTATTTSVAPVPTTTTPATETIAVPTATTNSPTVAPPTTTTTITTTTAVAPSPSGNPNVPACQKSIAEIQGDSWRSKLTWACNIEVGHLFPFFFFFFSFLVSLIYLTHLLNFFLC